MKHAKLKILISVFIMITGVFILSYSLTLIINYLYNYNHYEKTNGKIVGYTLGENKNMIISYEVDGKEYKIQSTFTEKDNHPVGSLVVVRYNKKSPKLYILGNEELDFKMVTAGAVLCVVGLSGMVMVYNKENNKGEENGKNAK